MVWLDLPLFIESPPPFDDPVELLLFPPSDLLLDFETSILLPLLFSTFTPPVLVFPELRVIPRSSPFAFPFVFDFPIVFVRDLDFPSLEEIDASDIRCPHPETATRMIELIKKMRDQGDSVGGALMCRVRGLPVGLGSPVFDRLEADLAKAMLSLPATKAFEVGSGFAGTYLKGSEHNDPFEIRDGEIRTTTNNSGGVQGGISNGEELYFRTGFKPTGTILKEQDTVSKDKKNTKLKAKGRHDPCVLPRAVPIVEAMTALTLVDHWLMHHAQNKSFDF